MANQEKSVRIQTSLLNPYEKVVLLYLGKKVPSFITSDHMTAIGVFGSLVVAIGYLLTLFGPEWLWLASFGFLINWFGDSLDGNLARIRNQQRPLYGFYVDHNLDCVGEFLMVGGAGLSVYMSMWVALLIIVPYLMLEVYVMINAHLKNEFKLTYGKLGPTELRLIIILVNTCIYFITPLQTWNIHIMLLGRNARLSAMDIAGLFIVACLFGFYFTSFWKDAKYFSKIDPLIKSKQPQ